MTSVFFFYVMPYSAVESTKMTVEFYKFITHCKTYVHCNMTNSRILDGDQRKTKSMMCSNKSLHRIALQYKLQRLVVAHIIFTKCPQ